MASSSAVKRHYDAVAPPPRSRTRLGPLRDFHNHAKRRLIAEEAGDARVVVDVACGKGGDLPKLPRGTLRTYVGVDVSPACLAEARSRAASLLPRHADVRFVEADFRHPPADLLPPGAAADLVNCQFALHYLWGDEATARRALGAMAGLLRPGGTLLVTTGDADVIVARLPASPLRFGRPGLYEVAFAERPSEESPFAGHGYAFTLVDGGRPAIDACPEFLVHGPTLVRLAGECGLELVRERNLTHLGEGYAGEVPPDQWEVTGLYRAFVFRRRAPSSPPSSPPS